MEPYTLEGRELPNPNGPGSPPDEDMDYAPCIFCGKRICHINDGGEGWLLGAVVEGQTRYYLYHNKPCIDGRTRDLAIWRCGCESDYVENVGPTCHCCGRKREECIPGDHLGPCKGCHKEWSARIHLGENTCPHCGTDWRAASGPPSPERLP